jgi:hypothetical protein
VMLINAIVSNREGFPAPVALKAQDREALRLSDGIDVVREQTASLSLA